MLVQVEPLCTGDAGTGNPPDGCGGSFGCSASTFICCVPPDNASCTLPQVSRSNSTSASGCMRYCTVMFEFGPVRRASYFVAALRRQFSTHPRSIHGCGGESRSKPPCVA